MRGAAGSYKDGHVVVALLRALKLRFAGEILPGPDLIGVAEASRGVQSEVRIGEVGPRQRAQICTAGGDNRIQMVGFGDVADSHRGYADFVTDPVGEWGLEHAAIDRFSLD